MLLCVSIPSEGDWHYELQRVGELIMYMLNTAIVHCHVNNFHTVSTVFMCYVSEKDKPSGWTRTFDLGRQIAVWHSTTHHFVKVEILRSESLRYMALMEPNLISSSLTYSSIFSCIYYVLMHIYVCVVWNRFWSQVKREVEEWQTVTRTLNSTQNVRSCNLFLVT